MTHKFKINLLSIVGVITLILFISFLVDPSFVTGIIGSIFPGQQIIKPPTPTFALTQFTSKDQIKSEFDYLDQAMHNGQCFRTWGPMDLSYEHAECINAQIAMYDTTKDIKYLNEARDNLNLLYDKAGVCSDTSKIWGGLASNIGTNYKTWRCWYPVPVDYLQPGKLIQAFAHYVDVVEKNNVAEHKTESDKFKSFLINDQWNDFKAGFLEYTINGEKRGCFGYMNNGKIDCDNNNRAAQHYDFLLYLYEWTGDTKFKDMYIEWARYFRNAIHVKEDTPHVDTYYSWNYHNTDPAAVAAGLMFDPCSVSPGWVCDGPSEVGKGYGSQEVIPIIHGYKDGIYWTKDDMLRFSNVITKAAGAYKANVYSTTGQLLKSNATVLNVYESLPSAANTWANQFVSTPNTYGWIDFAMVDTQVFVMEEEIVYNDYFYQKSTGDFWTSSFYQCVANPLANPNVGICAQKDGESSVRTYANPGGRMYSLAKIHKYAQ